MRTTCTTIGGLVLTVMMTWSSPATPNTSEGSRGDPGSIGTGATSRSRATATAPHSPYTLCLGGTCRDPLLDGRTVQPGWAATSRGNGAGLYLLQLHGPTRERVVDDLRTCGLELFQYIHPFTYVVWGDEAAMQCARSVSSVRWTGVFQPADAVLPQWRALGPEPVASRIVSYDGGGESLPLQELEALGATMHSSRVVSGSRRQTLADVPGHAYRQLAQHSAVYTIQPIPQDGGTRTELGGQVVAGNIDGTGFAYVGYGTWLAGLGLDGSGVTIANVDSGIDQSHPDLASRMLSCTGTTCGGSALSSHGTHTAGIMAGDGTSGTTDAGGFLRGLGVAPGARLVEQLYLPTFTEPGGMLTLMTDSVRNGAVLSGNSWGPSGSPQGYDADTRQVDVGTRDADPSTPGHQPLLYVLSIMNGYGGVSSQGTPDEAKNILTVGSTRLQTPSGAQSGAFDDLSGNTAHGPALDGRTIPHIVAPGCYVDSTVPSDSWGLKCGTSMASPHVSGAAALFVEQRRQLGLPDPSPALTKAALLLGADSLAGHLDADGQVMAQPFTSTQGWGRLNLASVLDPGVATMEEDQGVLLDATGESWTELATVDDPEHPVRLMLAWTDAPGHGLGGSTPAWCNDLDLEVTLDGQSSPYHGNSFDGNGWSVAGQPADFMNNTEAVFLPPGTSGPIAIRVLASNITSDAVPGFGDGTDQDFALVGYNLNRCTARPAFSGVRSVEGKVAGQPAAITVLWNAAASGCGGSVLYHVFSDRGTGPVDWSTPVRSTEGLGYVMYGVAPDIPICFGVRASELGRSETNTVTACATTYGTPIVGDANCSGGVTTSDLVQTVAVLFGAEDCGLGLVAADADESGSVDAGDLTWQVAN